MAELTARVNELESTPRVTTAEATAAALDRSATAAAKHAVNLSDIRHQELQHMMAAL